jgi:hypothetical protein
MRNRKIACAVIGIAAIGVISGLAGCGSTPAASPAASTSTSATAKPTPVKLTAAQLAAKKAAAAKAAAAAKKALAEAAAEAKAAAAAAKKAAAQAAAAAAAKKAAEDIPISATQWGDVIRNPSAYTGDVYTISGTVAEYNINSNTFATVENAALVATDANGNDFVVEADASKLGNVQPGQTFTAKVTVVGVAQTQNTVSGGSGQVPDFDASAFTVTG